MHLTSYIFHIFRLRNLWYLMVIHVSINFSSAKCELNCLPLRKSVLQSRGYPCYRPCRWRELYDGDDVQPVQSGSWRWCASPVCGVAMAAACDTQYCFSPSARTRVPYSGYTVPRVFLPSAILREQQPDLSTATGDRSANQAEVVFVCRSAKQIH